MPFNFPRFRQLTRKFYELGKIAVHDEPHTTIPHQSRHSNHSHHDGHHHGHHGDKLIRHYYGTGLAALAVGAAGGIFAFGYGLATGEIREKATEAWQKLRPPAVPGNVEMVSLDTKTCLPIPKKINQLLNRGFLSPHRSTNTLVISGESGGGKFDLARQIAAQLRAQSSKPSDTIIEISGHTRENMERGIVEVAKKLGLPKESHDLNQAKSFLRKELYKRPKTIFIVRCLRAEALSDGEFPLQDIIKGSMWGMVKPNVSVIYTTGQDDVIEQAKKNNFSNVSLIKSYRVEDLLSFIDTLPDDSLLKAKVKKEGKALLPLLVNKSLQNNPALARMAIPFMDNSSISIGEYVANLNMGAENAILSQSLGELKDPLSLPLLRKIAVLPQRGIPIDSLADELSGVRPNNPIEACQKISSALNELETLALVRVDPQNNRVYPVMLVSQARDLLKENTIPKATNSWVTWLTTSYSKANVAAASASK